MKIQKIQNNEERHILIGMIVDKTVLSKISSIWERDLFKTKWSNLISKWCTNYFRKYEDAPKGHLQPLFESWAERTRDKDTVEMIGTFLSSLSDEYEELSKDLNSEYVIDLAGKHFNKIKLERLADTIQEYIISGKVAEAQARVGTFGNIEIGVGSGIDVFQNREVIEEAFGEQIEPLIEYPSALKNFFGNTLSRDSFIALMGPEKRGKTFWLIDIAFRGMLQRRKVAFFQVGDMSQNQMMRRLMVRVARRPLYPSSIQYPTYIERDIGSRRAEVLFKKKTFEKKLSWRKSWKACKELMTNRVKSQESYFRLSTHPNDSVSVFDIRDILSRWGRDGWVPDIVVIDYADILKMDVPGLDKRDQIDRTWKQLRALSQSLHCLVVTATQSDASSYKMETIQMENFSEDKRKHSHVTGTIGLNQTKEENKLGVMRLNWIVVREHRFNSHKCCYVAGCLDIANPAIKSTF